MCTQPTIAEDLELLDDLLVQLALSGDDVHRHYDALSRVKLACQTPPQ